jgi:hypothetical protein
MRRQATGDAEAYNARTTAHELAGIRYCCREFGGQVAAVTATNDMHTRPCGDARFKCQSDDDDHEAPTCSFDRIATGDPKIARACCWQFSCRHKPWQHEKANRSAGSALGHDRRRGLAFASVRTAGDAKKRENNCRSE